MINLNPLSILKKRKLTFVPPHFSKMKIDQLDFQFQEIERWIENKLNGRYFIIKQPTISSKDSHLKTSTFVGFEDQKEITYFILACPYLRRI